MELTLSTRSIDNVDAEEYSKSAAKFFNRKLPPIQVLTNASMGCAGEAGEFVDHIKKVAFHGHDLDAIHVIKELGDQLWYINYAIYALNLLGYTVTLSKVMQENIDKLEARYPNGFSSEASRNRDEGADKIHKFSRTARLIEGIGGWRVTRSDDGAVLGRWGTYAEASLAWDAYHSDEAAARLGSRQ